MIGVKGGIKPSIEHECSKPTIQTDKKKKKELKILYSNNFSLPAALRAICQCCLESQSRYALAMRRKIVACCNQKFDQHYKFEATWKLTL